MRQPHGREQRADHDGARERARGTRRARALRPSGRRRCRGGRIVRPSATNTTISASDASASWQTACDGASMSPTRSPGTNTARKPEPCATVGDRRDDRDERRACAAEPDAAGVAARRSRPRCRPPARSSSAPRTSRTTIQKLASACVASSISPEHQRDPDRVVRAGLALEDRARTRRATRGRRAPRTSPPGRSARSRRRAGRPSSSRARARQWAKSASRPAVANVPRHAERERSARPPRGTGASRSTRRRRTGSRSARSSPIELDVVDRERAERRERASRSESLRPTRKQGRRAGSADRAPRR